ncbi:MAG: glycosyltransferase family 2 protein, partial [Hominenteromicrobium sp.]
MADQPFFSIIMPVYGVENYLADSVASVLKQTDPDFELILVDDCSKDRSGAICDELAASDRRIRVLHLEANGGLSNARNRGLALVRGSYVFYMDSDDEIDGNLLRTVRAAIAKNPAEVTVFGMLEEYYNANNQLKYVRKVCVEDDLFFGRQSDLREYVITLEEKTLYGYACNKVYSADYLRAVHACFQNVALI